MSETIMNQTSGFDFPPVLQTEADHEAYYLDAFNRVKAGETVWVQRNFDNENGRIFDLFSDKKPIGYVDQEYDDMRCDVYVYSVDGDTQLSRLANDRRLQLQEAVDLLSQAL